MKLQLGPEIISSYKRLSYQTWFALAEFVDNSTQAYFNNRSVLDKAFANEKTKLTVDIKYGRDNKGEYLRISDNAIGMSQDELENAVVIGRPPANARGRSRYGLGLKTGASWFGDLWTVDTKKLGENTGHKITVNVLKVAKGNMNLPHKKYAESANKHYTVIEIRRLHRKISGRTIGKVKDYLRSLYRVDIRDKRLVLRWDGRVLTWDEDIEKRLYQQANGKPAKKSFRFRLGNKRVWGWAGVLANGSRKDAGFSMIQSDRVIMGWPDSYRPKTIFGEQEGGSNDLVNQRLFGELFLQGFEVSHTKDQILFDDHDQDRLELRLQRELKGLRQLALTYRKGVTAVPKELTDAQREEALTRLQAEMRSPGILNFLRVFEIPSASLIKKSNTSLTDDVVRKFAPDLEAKLNNLTVSLYLVRDMSPNDPYLLIEATESDSAVTIVINLVHPHWSELTKEESIFNFIKHCTYDGVAEWKAYSVTHKLDPDTIKLIKDNLLRLPLKMKAGA
jgi:hypothetical protein